MSNYIDREVLLEGLENSVVISCKTEKVPQMQRVLSKIINCIKDQPTADVAEVRCGEWIAIKGFLQYSNCYYTKYYRCSVCNEQSYHTRNYCPECGTKMNEEHENNVKLQRENNVKLHR